MNLHANTITAVDEMDFMDRDKQPTTSRPQLDVEASGGGCRFTICNTIQLYISRSKQANPVPIRTDAVFSFIIMA